jgi:hypothetical protein
MSVTEVVLLDCAALCKQCLKTGKEKADLNFRRFRQWSLKMFTRKNMFFQCDWFEYSQILWLEKFNLTFVSHE